MRILICCMLLFLVSCEKKEIKQDSGFSEEDLKVETAKDIEMLYSDSAVVRVKLTAPVSLRHLDRAKPKEVFPESIKVSFYDQNGRNTSWLTSKYAERLTREKKVIARDSVVLFNSKNEKLFTEELIWDELKKQIYTDRFVIIKRPGGEEIYSMGIVANEDFSEYELTSVEGDWRIDDIIQNIDQ